MMTMRTQLHENYSQFSSNDSCVRPFIMFQYNCNVNPPEETYKVNVEVDTKSAFTKIDTSTMTFFMLGEGSTPRGQIRSVS